MVPQYDELAAAGSRRQSARFRLADAPVMTLVSDGRRLSCRLVDISLGGVGLRVEAELSACGDLVLEHPVAGAFPLRRVWLVADRLGACFQSDEPKLEHTLRCIQLVLNAKGSPQP